jgi:ribosomal protein S18 acetylase RimI-like enzyme
MVDSRVHIRTMDEAERADVFALAEEVLRPLAAASGHLDRFSEDQFMELMERGEVYVAEPASGPRELAGYVIVETEMEQPEDETPTLALRCLCLSPAFEESTVGDRLLEWAEGLAYSRGAARMLALLPPSDQPSQKLYRTHEFVPVPADDRPETIVMEKRLW